MIESQYENLRDIPSVENLSNLNISLSKAIIDSRAPTGASKIFVIDILSDVVLRHKLLVTCRWLSDFIAKRKAQGFTIVATLNPSVAPKEETQTITDLFDGMIEIFEKEVREKSRRFLRVKKMYGRRYSETELMLEKEKLF